MLVRTANLFRKSTSATPLSLRRTLDPPLQHRHQTLHPPDGTYGVQTDSGELQGLSISARDPSVLHEESRLLNLGRDEGFSIQLRAENRDTRQIEPRLRVVASDTYISPIFNECF